jgi:hypothetical protein
VGVRAVNQEELQEQEAEEAGFLWEAEVVQHALEVVEVEELCRSISEVLARPLSRPRYPVPLQRNAAG